MPLIKGDIRSEATLGSILVDSFDSHADTAKVDAAGALHHVIGRGIDGGTTFRNTLDRDGFINHPANSEELAEVS